MIKQKELEIVSMIKIDCTEDENPRAVVEHISSIKFISDITKN